MQSVPEKTPSGPAARTVLPLAKRTDCSIEHRREGVASRIIEALLVRARELALGRVFLHTLTEQLGAQQLYRAIGFHEAGRGEIHGNAVGKYELALEKDGG